MKVCLFVAHTAPLLRLLNLYCDVKVAKWSDIACYGTKVRRKALFLIKLNNAYFYHDCFPGIQRAVDGLPQTLAFAHSGHFVLSGHPFLSPSKIP